MSRQIQDIKLDKIEDYQIEIRGRIMGLNLDPYQTIARYEVIAASFEEAADLVREYENNHRCEHGLVKCTMRLA